MAQKQDSSSTAVWATFLSGGTLVDLRGVKCVPGDLCVVPPRYLEDPRGAFVAAKGEAGEWTVAGRTWVVKADGSI